MDAGVIRGGQLVDEHQSQMVGRVTRAQQRLAADSGTLPDDGATEELSDTPNYLDPSRLVLPLARPTIAYRLYRSGHRYSRATITAAKVFLAATLAAVAGIALGLGRPDWAIVSALLML